MQKKSYIILLHLTFIFIGQSAFSQPKHVLTLSEAVKNALKTSPSYLSAKNAAESTKLESKNAFANFLPSIDLSASHGVKGKNPDITGELSKTPIVSGASLTLTESLYDNGESAKKYKIAKLKHDLANINLEKTKAQIIRQVLLAYYRHNIELQNLRFTQKNFDELERLARLVSNQFHQGMKTRKDYLSFKTKSHRSRLDVITAEKKYTKARSQLFELIGISPDANTTFDESVKPLIPKKALSIDISTESLYEYKTISLQKRISESEIALASRKFWPEISLIGAASYGSSDYIDTKETWSDNDLTQWSVLLNLKFNLLDWGVRSRNIQIAKLNTNTIEQSLNSQLLESLTGLEQFKLEVKRAEESYRLSKDLQKMEEDNFALLERDYRTGNTTYLELTTGLANLLDAQSRGLEADYQQSNLYLQWKYYKGILSEETIFE